MYLSPTFILSLYFTFLMCANLPLKKNHDSFESWIFMHAQKHKTNINDSFAVDKIFNRMDVVSMWESFTSH